MTRTKGRPSSAAAILDTALRLLDEGATVSLESVAHGAGLTKPGLMYHFPTKAALMEALVDHVVDTLEQDLLTRLPVPVDEASAAQRIGAYLRWSLGYAHRRSDLVMLSDPKLADRMTARWTERFDKWVEVPAELPAPERTRLHTARLLADGAWFVGAIDTFPVPADDRPDLLRFALELLEGPTS
ncbi:TetR/AcrR family transcriptional regulator [Nocardia salmonicida]|uniref:TetR/AcrR family transcriptional regulator n=1 Tax=Nocardia TaxID=1817 RepID=UPI00265A0C8D|nr:TetR/AcrR family transcriptional regulator [Nocardia sp. PE-7]WKG13060.1 TetR/AcrR family transcriptional regulator [Nocardia sp. PE-7]